jgi:hypothetical protein
MNITNLKPILLQNGFEQWNFDLDGTNYTYLTNTCSRWAPDHRLPYARIFGNKHLYVRKFMPLNPENPVPDLMKFYKLLLLQ